MKARAKLATLSRWFQKNPKSVVRITQPGKRAMTLMSAELYETLTETLEAVSDQTTFDALRKGFRDIELDRVHTLGSVAAQLELTR